MSRVGSKNTSPEIVVRKVLHSLGYRFRLHGSKLVGRPDVVLSKHRAVVFVHGCFWHRHAGCKKAGMPKSRVAFWRQKFERNVERDAAVKRQLRKQGWRVLTVWQCQTRRPEFLRRRLERFLKPNN